MNIKFQLNNIKNVLIDFYMVTGHQIALFNREGENLIRYPQNGSPLCEAIQATKIGRKRCEQCDNLGIQKAISLGDLYTYTCHAGLLEICLPIKLDKNNGEIIGFMMIGHLLDCQDTSTPQWENICRKCEDILPDIHEMHDSFHNISAVSQEYIRALCNMLKGCVSYIAYEQLFIQASSGLWENLRQFIVQNAAETFTVPEIASALSVSVSTLNRCAIDNSGHTAGKLLLQERLSLACNFLKSTDLPIAKVAKASGVPDYNYFSRVFKKQMDMSPSQFREQY